MQPAKYKEVCGKMENLANHTVYSEFIYEPSVAYTYSRTDSLKGTVYRIFVNSKDRELAEYLYLHECGHIIFGHAKDMELRMDRFLSIKMEIAYRKIARYFPNYEEYLKVFKNAVFNIVMDFEVNSRLYTPEEWTFMNRRLSAFLGKEVTGMWPQDYGYAPDLTWNEYLTQILLNPENFMKHFYEYLKQESGEGEEETEEDTKEQDKLSEKQLKKLREIENLHEKGSFRNERKMSGNSTLERYVKEQSLDIYTDTAQLFKKLTSVLDVKTRKNSRQDTLYNYNRRKYNTGVLIKKQRQEEVLNPGKLFVLFDVSGSVDLKLVNGLIRTFREEAEHYRETRFISWNVDLVQEWGIKENLNLKFGGGTDIASGIFYLNRKYKPGPRDLVFVISDFYDDLQKWQTELKKVKAHKYGVNWRSWYRLENPGFRKIFQYIKK